MGCKGLMRSGRVQGEEVREVMVDVIWLCHSMNLGNEFSKYHMEHICILQCD